jgi:hypothetical protein
MFLIMTVVLVSFSADSGSGVWASPATSGSLNQKRASHPLLRPLQLLLPLPPLELATFWTACLPDGEAAVDVADEDDAAGATLLRPLDLRSWLVPAALLPCLD